MHDSDETELKRMIGGATALPEVIVAAYEKRRAFRNMSTIGSGPMSVDALVQVLIDAGQVPPTRNEIVKAAQDWKDFRRGDAVELKVEGKWIAGTFVALAQLAQIDVKRAGEDRVFRMKAFEVRPVVRVEVPVTAENAEGVQVFADGQWVDGTLKRRRSDGNVEVMLPNDTRSYRLFKPENVRTPALASA